MKVRLTKAKGNLFCLLAGALAVAGSSAFGAAPGVSSEALVQN